MNLKRFDQRFVVCSIFGNLRLSIKISDHDKQAVVVQITTKMYRDCLHIFISQHMEIRDVFEPSITL